MIAIIVPLCNIHNHSDCESQWKKKKDFHFAMYVFRLNTDKIMMNP